MGQLRASDSGETLSLSLYIYVYIYIYPVCVCVCLGVWVELRRELMYESLGVVTVGLCDVDLTLTT